MALIFHDDCSSLDNWTICTDEGHVHYGELFADGDCIYITQENINNNYYDSRQDFYQDCLIGLQDFILEAQIKYEYSKPQREQVASIALYNTENPWERIGFIIQPNIDYSGMKGGLYCTNAGSFTFSQNLNYTDDILTYKLCRTGNVLDLYINDIKRGTYENSEIGLVNISGININLGKSRLTDESSLKIPAIYDINISQPPYQFTYGSGTESDPYQVWTSNDLNGVRDYLDAHYIQMADIDLSGVEWVSIAESGVSFQGVYNGNGYLIKNINNPLFGFTQYSTIKKLGLTDVNITSAPLVNVGWGNIIEECFSTGIITSDTALQGGLLGFMQGWTIDDSIVGDIKNCYSRCKIVNTAEAIFTGDYNVGVGGLSAIAGWTIPMREISKCYYAGEMDIYDNESEYIGGIIGYTYIFPTTEGYDTCYYDTTLSGMVDTGKGTPKTTAQMKSEATYVGWDFDTVWGIDPAINDGYPYLRVFESESYDFQYGSGTEADPYQVWNADDLNGVRDYLDAHFIQMADIDLQEWSNWIPIGVDANEPNPNNQVTPENFFMGVYDGNGYKIKNFTSSGFFMSEQSGQIPYLCGLFFIIGQGGVVKKLSLFDFVLLLQIEGSYGAMAPFAFMCLGLIELCMSFGKITAEFETVDFASGFSIFNGGEIRNSYSIVTIENFRYAGGISGHDEVLVMALNTYSVISSATETPCNGIGLMYPDDPNRITNYYNSDLMGEVKYPDYDGVPKTTLEMKTEATFVGWDFDTVWGIDPAINDGYPYLRVFDKQEGISLNISIEGNGVTTPSAGTSYYEEGTKVLLTAKPGEGNKFIRWEGEGIEDTGGRVTRITMNGNKTVKAVFGEAVTLNLIAAGGGTTIPAPGKLTFAKGDVISLKGVPHKGFKFKEWMGDIIHTHDVQQFIIYDDMMVRAVFEEADEERRSPKRLYFATVKEKAFWRVDGKWRFFATPVHGNLKNLSTDDHKQYLTAERHDNTGRHTLGEVIPHDSHMNLLDRGIFTHSQIDNHLENLSNPHKVTAEQIGGASYESGPVLPEASEDYKGFFFSLIGDDVDEKLYYCRLKSDGETYEWKEIF